jgi:bacterioferritin-associated ferredoxin
MYVCICKGISDKDIRKVMTTQHNTRDILKALGVGSDCGQCVVEAIEVIKAEQGPKEFSHGPTVQTPSNQP